MWINSNKQIRKLPCAGPLSEAAASPPQMLPRRPLISLTCAVSQIGLLQSSSSSSPILRPALILAKRRMFSTKVEKCGDVAAAGYDAVVVVAPTVSAAPEAVSYIQLYNLVR